MVSVTCPKYGNALSLQSACAECKLKLPHVFVCFTPIITCVFSCVIVWFQYSTVNLLFCRLSLEAIDR